MRKHTSPQSFPVKLVRDHLLLHRDGHWQLLDTGSPVSAPCPAEVSDELGHPVARLLGCEQLAEQAVLLDVPQQRLHLGGPGPSTATLLPLQRRHGFALVPLQTTAGTVDAVLHTGAALSYCPAAAVYGLPKKRRASDFLPGHGRFEVDIYELDVAFGAEDQRLEFAVLPQPLAQAFRWLGEDCWILGTAMLRDRAVLLDLPNGELRLGPRRQQTTPSTSQPKTSRMQDQWLSCTQHLHAEPTFDGKVRVLVALSLSGKAAAGVNLPVDVALVLDHSGSMSGGPLAAVKQAAQQWLRHLPQNSRFSIIGYANRANLLQPLTAHAGGLQQAAETAIQTLAAGGGTALADGWQTGCHSLGLYPPDDQRLRRIVLMSDGQANIGERQPSVLAESCRRALGTGITTTTVGFGWHFDEDLMQAMAHAGGGSCWYVPGAAELDAVLSDELRAMGTVSALACRIEVQPSAELTALHGGEQPSPQQANRVYVGELSAAVERPVVLEFLLASATACDLATLDFHATAPDGVSVLHHQLKLRYAGGLQRNLRAQELHVRLQAARLREESVRAADSGNHGLANSLLDSVIQMVRQAPADLQRMLSSEQAEATMLIERLRQEGYSPALRKSLFHGAESRRTGKHRPAPGGTSPQTR